MKFDCLAWNRDVKIYYIIKLLTFLVIYLSSSSIYAKESDPAADYKFGVFPYLTSKHMHSIYSPVNQRLNLALHKKSEFITEPSHRRFIHKLNNEITSVPLTK